jgi:site-specific recombinase XerD
MPPTKPRNKDLRSREYLRPDEVELLLKAAGKTGRHRQRDRALILLMYRHGLRVGEAAGLRWHQIDWKLCQIHVQREKNGKPSVQPLNGDELRLLRWLRREHPDHPFVFIGELGAPLSERSIHRIVQRSGEVAGLDFSCHPHMLRHGRGFALAAKGYDTRAIQDYLGHREIKHTIAYTELSPQRFQDWLD